MKAIRKLSTALVMVAVLAPQMATAHVPASSTELNWRLGFVHYEDLDSQLLLGVNVARNLSSGNWGVEGSFGLALADDFKGYFVYGNGVYNIEVPEWERFVPFATAGLGFHSYSPDVGDRSTDLALNFGGGAKVFMTPKLAFRGDVLDNVIFFENNTTHNFQLSGGLTWFFRSDQ